MVAPDLPGSSAPHDRDTNPADHAHAAGGCVCPDVFAVQRPGTTSVLLVLTGLASDAFKVNRTT
jgi:hypothetical protein